MFAMATRSGKGVSGGGGRTDIGGWYMICGNEDPFHTSSVMPVVTTRYGKGVSGGAELTLESGVCICGPPVRHESILSS